MSAPPRFDLVPETGGDAGGKDRGLAGLNILLVEDEALIALDVRALLGGSACSVLGPYANVPSALAAIERTERIDCAILDINLGNEHSLSLADALIARSIPYVWVSGHAPDILPPRYRAQPFVSKPFSTQDLFDALKAAVGRAR